MVSHHARSFNGREGDPPMVKGHPKTVIDGYYYNHTAPFRLPAVCRGSTYTHYPSPSIWTKWKNRIIFLRIGFAPVPPPPTRSPHYTSFSRSSGCITRSYSRRYLAKTGSTVESEEERTKPTSHKRNKSSHSLSARTPLSENTW